MGKETEYWFSPTKEELKGDNPSEKERNRLNDEVAYLMGFPLTEDERLSIEKSRLYDDLRNCESN
tara:strand:- start:221 stop:415 length:195 start_codon:yes stop_codon:yes gene_type:complete